MAVVRDRIDRDRLRKLIEDAGPAIAAGLPPQVRQMATLLRRSGLLGHTDPLSRYSGSSRRAADLPTDELHAVIAYLISELVAIDGREWDAIELAAAKADRSDPLVQSGLGELRAIALDFLG